jgi:hypothetical protein
MVIRVAAENPLVPGNELGVGLAAPASGVCVVVVAVGPDVAVGLVAAVSGASLYWSWAAADAVDGAVGVGPAVELVVGLALGLAGALGVAVGLTVGLAVAVGLTVGLAVSNPCACAHSGAYAHEQPVSGSVPWAVAGVLARSPTNTVASSSVAAIISLEPHAPPLLCEVCFICPFFCV